MAPDELFASVVDALERGTGVTQSRMFGSPGLKVGGKVFAILVKGKLVVKLPKEEVGALVASGQGAYFDSGHGRPSKQWVAMEPNGPSGPSEWLSLAQEARDFVASGR